jgi:hypothetical protein
MDYPIIFSAPMIRALLDGRKTMTRRIPTTMWRKVAPGDRLYVRENWALHGKASDVCTVVYAATINRGWTETIEQFPVALAKDIPARPYQEAWRPNIHHPRAFSRLTLAVTAAKIERLQDISEEDAVAEGCRSFGPVPGDNHDVPTGGAADSFRALWESLHGAGAWEKNPELVALTFTVHKANIDQMQMAA